VRSTRDPNAEETTGPLQQTVKRLTSRIPHLNFILATAVLIIFVTIAAFIDASVLFAAFIAGGVVSFLWGRNQDQDEIVQRESPSVMYEQYFKSVMDCILVPFFFVSTISHTHLWRKFCSLCFKLSM
jgi:Kef-type K+ transport system membrane component KefB